MSTRQFAIVAVRFLGFTSIIVGLIIGGASGIMRALSTASLTGTSIPDIHLHDTYYVISHSKDAWLAPGAICVVTGILLLIGSRRLGTWLAQGTATDTST